MKVNKYLPFAILYFFFNSLLLPAGLTYTALLSPLFYWWVVKTRNEEILIPFIMALFPFILVHIYFVGVESQAYLKSLINLTAVYIFCQAFYTFLKVCNNIEKVLRTILYLNFFLCLIAIPLYFTSYYELLWIEQDMGGQLKGVRRLKLFTYEASYYASLFAPVFCFYFLQILLRQNSINSWILFPMLFITLILSFSVGVLSSLLIAFLVSFVFYFVSLLSRKRVVNIIAMFLLILIPGMVILAVFNPDNLLFERMQNILAGQDPSGKGRTSEAFTIANMLLEKKDQFWGIGIGQVKILGADTIRSFYMYPLDYPVITIPNVTAETLAIFGWIGLFIRFGLQIFLFVYTKVWTNYFRLVMFIFIFIYQFTGSFITNIAEYIIWILAFTNTFREFDVRPVKVKG
ncbi:MAG: hypothetical protein ACXWV9_00615 [Flavisolibacter sp.]